MCERGHRGSQPKGESEGRGACSQKVAESDVHVLQIGHGINAHMHIGMQARAHMPTNLHTGAAAPMALRCTRTRTRTCTHTGTHHPYMHVWTQAQQVAHAND